MKWGFVRSLGLLTAIASSHALDLCFVPGILGPNRFLSQTVRGELAQLGIPFHVLNTGSKGTVPTRARRMLKDLGRRLEQNPNLKCHLVGHSMGGVVIRYALNHGQIPIRGGRSIPLREIGITSTSLATPHRGTPLADLFGWIVPGFQKIDAEEMGVQAVRRYNSPESADYSPTPDHYSYYSYRAWAEQNILSRGMELLRFQILRHLLGKSGEDSQNDALVPTQSMGWGQVVADLRVPHSFFGSPTKGLPPMSDFLEAHQAWLEGRFEGYRSQSKSKWDALKKSFIFKGLN